MWDNQIVFRLTEESNKEPFLRVVALFVASTLSGYFTGKIVLALGFTSTKTNVLLTRIHEALGKSDFSAVSTLAKAFPKNCPEAGLAKLASLEGVHELRDIAKILDEANLIFHTVMHRLSLYLEGLRSVVGFSLFFLCLWFILRVREMALYTSSQTNFNASIVASSLSEVMFGAAELLAAIIAISFVERACFFRISARRDRWKLFLTSLTVWTRTS